MNRKNSEEPYRGDVYGQADERVRRLPPAFPETPLDKQEDYVERMIRRDREAERRQDL